MTQAFDPARAKDAIIDAVLEDWPATAEIDGARVKVTAHDRVFKLTADDADALAADLAATLDNDPHAYEVREILAEIRRAALKVRNA